LNKLNWSVKTDLYNYIKENKNVNWNNEKRT
jgi:hypothetical protein